MKLKVAIAIEKSLLNLIDNKVGSEFASRSQAIENLLRKGLQEELITSAVLLLRGDHQKYSLKKVGEKSLLYFQIGMLRAHGIKNVHIVTQKSPYTERFLAEVNLLMKTFKVIIDVHEKNANGNAQALAALKDTLSDNFIAMSADLAAEFDLYGMIKKHISTEKTATMALMLRDKPERFGNAVMDGDLVVNFVEKPKRATSYVVNAGIYILSPRIFSHIRNAVSLEKEVFPKLASSRQLAGHFIKGKYLHIES
ncbi:MAG: sugar phosphate nucleotidyltransferase [Nanoarchaeota archaeon]